MSERSVGPRNPAVSAPGDFRNWEMGERSVAPQPKIARRVYQVYRSLRSGLLWLVEPADLLSRVLHGRRGLPPLWLRRHTGPLHSYQSAASDMLRLIAQLGLVKPGDRVVDIGCGTGVMVEGLLSLTGSAGAYIGFDVHRRAINWCRRRYRNDPRCRFELALVSSPYATQAGVRIEDYSFPVADGEADFVLAKSVFTHLAPPEAQHYLREIHQTLRPGRGAIVTAFLFDATSRTATGRSSAFRCADETGVIRWRSRLRPQAAVAYEREYFFELVERASLRVQWHCPGFFPGDSDRLDAQDILLLGH